MRPIERRRGFVQHAEPWRPSAPEVGFVVEVSPSQRRSSTDRDHWLNVPDRFDVAVINKVGHGHRVHRHLIAAVGEVPGRKVDVVSAELRLWAWRRLAMIEDAAVDARRAQDRAAQR